MPGTAGGGGTVLQVPIAGSRLLLLFGTAVYLFATAAIGILLGTMTGFGTVFLVTSLLIFRRSITLSK